METEIVIVGGGLAGLALADALERAGAEYLLLEARDRLGGRILSATIDGAGFDLGPAWFWPVQSRMAALVNGLGLEAFEQFSTGAIVAEDRNGRVHWNAGLASMEGAYRVDGGLGRVTNALADRLPAARILRNVKVDAVARHGEGVLIEAGRDGVPKRIPAGRVVLAMPPRIAEATIRFSPGLPEPVRRALAVTPTWMAGQAKFLAVYDRPYWRVAGFSGDALSQRGPLSEIHDASPARGGPFALFGFVGSPAGVRHRYREQIMKEATRQLSRLFGAELLHPLHVELQDWSEDPLTATAADARERGDHPGPWEGAASGGAWDGRILFAGSECAVYFPGYLEGALEAAERTAARLGGMSRVG